MSPRLQTRRQITGTPRTASEVTLSPLCLGLAAGALAWNRRRLGYLLESACHQPASQVELIGVHRHRLGIGQGGRCRLLNIIFRQRFAFDRLFGGDGPVGSGRHTAQDHPVVEADFTVEFCQVLLDDQDVSLTEEFILGRGWCALTARVSGREEDGPDPQQAAEQDDVTRLHP